MNSKRQEDEAELRRITLDWVSALKAKDVEGVMKNAAPEILSFDVAPPLASRGSDQYRRNLEAWFPTWDGPIALEERSLEFTIGDEVAFSTSLSRIGGRKKDGEQPGLWVRVTVGFKKIEGRWLVVHEHVSTPFYMDGSFKAAVDLQPD